MGKTIEPLRSDQLICNRDSSIDAFARVGDGAAFDQIDHGVVDET